LTEPKVSAIFTTKYSKCKVRSELEVCDETKCKKCATQHLVEIEERWDAIEETLTEINNRRYS
jgi:hypothetical protein